MYILHIATILFDTLDNIYIKLNLTVNSELKFIVNGYYSIRHVSVHSVFFKKYKNIQNTWEANCYIKY
jgi:hypothetical protein